MSAAKPADWIGAWVAERLPAELVTEHSPVGVSAADLAGLALRRNPRRAQLVVSRVLGKHVPADPRLVYGTGLLLGELVRRALVTPTGAAAPASPADPLAACASTLRAALAGPVVPAAAGLPAAVRAAQPPGTDPAVFPAALVIGYAETATSLGHAVADALRTAGYLHSTRRPVAGVPVAAGFDESHSHATGHLLLPGDPGLLCSPDPVVLVDDELTTGRTVLGTIAALHRVGPRERYVVAALLDLRRPADRRAFADLATELGAGIEVVALASGRLDLPRDAASRAAAVLAAAGGAPRRPSPWAVPGEVVEIKLDWPCGVPLGGRHGFGPADRARLEAALPAMAAQVEGVLTHGQLLVLGVEELMYVPLRLASALADRAHTAGRPAAVAVSSTTRSPVHPVDDPGYAIRTCAAFPAHDDPADGPGERYAYNLLGPGGERRFTSIVLLLDAASDTPELRKDGGLLDQLRAACDQVVLCALPETEPAAEAVRDVSPQGRLSAGAPADKRSPGMSSRRTEPLRGPGFGSYHAEEVGWLLTDLSHVPLEAPLEQREVAVQSGAAHYAESLPIEYRPGPEYLALFERGLAENTDRIAHAVGLVTEAVLAGRGPGAVLVSLARAGTPIGILMRRWAARVHALALPHYAVSIVRGRGIDEVALRWLTQHHDPALVAFVDGWTGKGAIARELRAALRGHAASGGARFDPDLAVLADPGGAAPLVGTREDFLVPSACLNSTVSGLVSRTVLRADLIGPGDFHGAKFYPELAADDVSARFLDAVSARFDAVAPAVAADVTAGRAEPQAVTGEGWRAVERICADTGIADANLVKPGVGETTRVLLRRVPWKVLVRARDAGGPELAHIRLLAAERGVPVEPVADLPYRCVGLIRPGGGADS